MPMVAHVVLFLCQSYCVEVYKLRFFLQSYLQVIGAESRCSLFKVKRYVLAAELVEAQRFIVEMPFVDVGGAILVGFDQAAWQVFHHPLVQTKVDVAKQIGMVHVIEEL